MGREDGRGRNPVPLPRTFAFNHLSLRRTVGKGTVVRYEVTEKDDILIFELSGYLTGHADTYEFLEDARERIAAGARKIVVNLAGIEKVNSSGIGVLAAVISSATNAEASLRFANIPGSVWKIMAIVGLSRVVTNHPSTEEAVADL